MKTKQQAKRIWMDQAERAFEKDWNAKQTCVYCKDGTTHLYHSTGYADIIPGDY